MPNIFDRFSIKCGSMGKRIKSILMAVLFYSFGFVFINTSEDIDNILNHVVNQKASPEANVASMRGDEVILERSTPGKKVDSGPPYLSKKNDSSPSLG